MIKAFGYLRVSGKTQLEGDGFPRQRAAIESYAAQEGMTIETWYEERATPGKTEWEERPAWAEMALSLTEGRVILIERLDRLARDLMVQEHIIADLRKRHVTLISTAEPDLCIDDPTRKLLRQIMGAIAEYDRTMIVRKMKAARDRIKKETGKCEGRKSYGFRAGEAETINFIKALRLKGLTWQRVADYLNEANTPTRQPGSRWYPATVQKIFKASQSKR